MRGETDPGTRTRVYSVASVEVADRLENFSPPRMPVSQSWTMATLPDAVGSGARVRGPGVVSRESGPPWTIGDPMAG